MSYTLAWIIALAAGLAGTAVLYRLTRSMESLVLRNLLCLLPLALLLVPAPVPGFSGNFAPAFVVALFETAFVAHGQPRAALVILAVASAGALLAIMLVSRAFAGREREITSDNDGN